jgi:hypothetical protein
MSGACIHAPSPYPYASGPGAVCDIWAYRSQPRLAQVLHGEQLIVGVNRRSVWPKAGIASLPRTAGQEQNMLNPVAEQGQLNFERARDGVRFGQEDVSGELQAL